MRTALIIALSGILFGFSLNRIGFTSWDEVHEMFVFTDLRMLLGFGFAIVLLVPAWWGLSRTGRNTKIKRTIHNGTIVGGLLFGAGWAISGACPSIAMVQLGEGQTAAAWTLLGMFLGNWLYAAVHARYFNWTHGSCLDD